MSAGQKNQGHTYSEVITARRAGQSVHSYLSARYTHSSPARWRQRIESGQVSLDGERASPELPLMAGQRLSYHRPAWVEPQAPLHFEVLYQDAHVVVVSKPSGLPSMAGGGFLENTLVHLLRDSLGAAPVHRLGRYTSGAVLCARSPSAAAHISAQLSGRRILKRYLALGSGSPSWQSLHIQAPIGPVPYPPIGTLHASSPQGRHASSHVQVLARRQDHQSFLAQVQIDTGRPHQIRVHMAWAGHPLLGDPLYVKGGGPAPGGQALPGAPGYQLHSWQIGFVHPVSGAPMTVRAPAPPLLQR